MECNWVPPWANWDEQAHYGCNSTGEMNMSWSDFSASDCRFRKTVDIGTWWHKQASWAGTGAGARAGSMAVAAGVAAGPQAAAVLFPGRFDSTSVPRGRRA